MAKQQRKAIRKAKPAQHQTKTVVDKVKCGECGGELYRMQHLRPAGDVRLGGSLDDSFNGTLVAICEGCGDETTISVRLSVLTADGNMCGGWDEEDD